MRRVFLLLSACFVMSLVLASAAMAQEGAGPEGEGPCTGTFEQYIPEVNGCVLTEGSPNPGQSTVFDADTGEPIGTLDEVNADIEAGETGQPAQRTPSFAETPRIEKPRNCDEFGGSQSAAQEFLENVTPDDQFNLDADNDGVACEGLLPGGQEGTGATDDTSSATTEQYVDTGEDQYAEDTGEINTLPDTGGPPLGVIGAGAGLLLVGGGLLLKRRLT